MAYLSLGSTGEEVRKLQNALRNQGYDIEADAIFGPKTAAALRDFQRSKGFEPDAIFGPKTEAALFSSSSSPSASSSSSPATGTNDNLAKAWELAKQQALGAGVSPDKIDPLYVQALASGNTEGYMKYATGLAQPQSNRISTALQNQQGFSYTPGSTINWSEALRQAEAQLSPLYDIQSTQKLRQIQQDLLRRGIYGQPFSGDIAVEALAPLEAARNAAIAQAAQNILQQAQAAELQNRQQAFQEWLSQQNLGLNREQLAQQIAMNEWQKTLQEAGLTGLYNGQPTLQKALQEAGLTGIYNGQPTLQKQQYDWQKALEQQQLDWQKQYQSALLASRNQSATSSGTTQSDSELVQQALKLAQGDLNWSTSDLAGKQAILQGYIDLLRNPTGSSSEGTSSNEELLNVYSAIDAAVANGTPPDTIISSIRAQESELAKAGVSVDDAISYAQSAYKKAHPSWYTRLDQALGGWLPFGAPRK